MQLVISTNQRHSIETNKSKTTQISHQSLTLSLRIPGNTGYKKMSVNRAYLVVPGIQKIIFKICGWIGRIAIYCFFYELEAISACFPVDMSAMAGAQRPGRRYTASEEVVDEFFADTVSSKWFLNKTMEIIQTIDVFVILYIFTNI
jgi:hypothetical protein